MGFADRDYARATPFQRPTGGERALAAFRRSGPVGWIVATLVAAFFIELILKGAGHAAFVRDNIVLTAPALRAGKVWTLLTYALSHADLIHLLVNALGLWFFGNAVRRENGTRRFLEVFLLGLFGGASAWAALWLPGGHPAPFVLGSSAGVFALTAYHLADKLRDELTLLLFFVLPITLEAGWLLAVAGGISLIGLGCTEIPAATRWYPLLIADNTLCHSAHAAGLALGFGWRRWEIRARQSRAEKTRRRFSVIGRETAPENRRFPAGEKPSGVALRPEVDRILDKINAHGLGSLSSEERDTLDRARDTLRR